jgi:hypothetical protein
MLKINLKQQKATMTLTKITTPFLHLQIGLQRLTDTKLFRTIIKKIYYNYTNALTYCMQDRLHHHSSTCAHAREGEREREKRHNPLGTKLCRSIKKIHHISQ